MWRRSCTGVATFLFLGVSGNLEHTSPRITLKAGALLGRVVINVGSGKGFSIRMEHVTEHGGLARFKNVSVRDGAVHPNYQLTGSDRCQPLLRYAFCVFAPGADGNEQRSIRRNNAAVLRLIQPWLRNLAFGQRIEMCGDLHIPGGRAPRILEAYRDT